MYETTNQQNQAIYGGDLSTVSSRRLLRAKPGAMLLRLWTRAMGGASVLRGLTLQSWRITHS